ncbi:class I SAM-dependent methyltransferase [Candidatus Nanohalococcus occultus]|uniref:SAM-dependent methyltransferase n=1 Tax=Candidatus Nanohalococcus occultus TaxID=2978047 RepID=A0ABY8CDB8_9ARCH|nr:SAM-dependent methyltransferase [Candidatus Nanohaloarchaeota archaeon SVXNc]
MSDRNSNARMESAFNNARTKFEQDYSLEVMKQKFPEYIGMMDRFGKLIGENGKVLDAGCGHGRDIRHFNDIGLNAVGIDIAEDLLEDASRKGLEVAKMDVRDLSFDDETFDGIWCNSVLHFLNPAAGDMQQALKELTRILKTGGVLYINFKLGKGETMREDYEPSLRQFHLPESAIKEVLNNFPLKKIHSEKAPEMNTVSLFLKKTG